MSNSLQPHQMQHTRLPSPSLPPRVCSNSCPLSQWCYLSHPLLHPSPPLALNLSHHQSFPVSWLFAPSSQSTGASVSVFPMTIHCCCITSYIFYIWNMSMEQQKWLHTLKTLRRQVLLRVPQNNAKMWGVGGTELSDLLCTLVTHFSCK